MSNMHFPNDFLKCLEEMTYRGNIQITDLLNKDYIT